jgi:hypothetical protein
MMLHHLRHHRLHHALLDAKNRCETAARSAEIRGLAAVDSSGGE